MSAPVPDLLGALASVLGVAVEDLPETGPYREAIEPDVDEPVDGAEHAARRQYGA